MYMHMHYTARLGSSSSSMCSEPVSRWEWKHGKNGCRLGWRVVVVGDGGWAISDRWTDARRAAWWSPGGGTVARTFALLTPGPLKNYHHGPVSRPGWGGISVKSGRPDGGYGLSFQQNGPLIKQPICRKLKCRPFYTASVNYLLWTPYTKQRI